MNAAETLQRMRELGVILVVRTGSPREALEGIRAVMSGGLRGIEITFSVPNAPEVISGLNRSLGEEILLGAGTVTTPQQAEQAVAAGAKYLVAPNTDEKVIAAARKLGAAMVPGAFTATEVLRAWDLGADIVKIFPANLGGPAYIKALRGPYPHIPLMPSGGVDEKNVGEFFKAGAFAVGAGGALFDAQKLKAQDWAGMAETARKFVVAMDAARGK